MARILYITPMWHDATAPNDPKVCNYFVQSWVQQGHSVIAIHVRSCFPIFYKHIAKLVPSIYNRLRGDNSELMTDTRMTKEVYSGATVYSYPLYKYVPHGRVSETTLKKLSLKICEEISRCGFVPDYIIGHFVNPTAKLIALLSIRFPNAKTTLTLHEGASTIDRVLRNKGERILNSFASIGYRSMFIQRDVENRYELTNHRFICYSGIASSFLRQPLLPRKWTDGAIISFLFVGRLVFYKHPKAVAQALENVYGKESFKYNIIGKQDVAYDDLCKYIEDNNLQNSVHCLGSMEREKIISWYDQSDCYVMISSHEVFGLVYLEAMARGCITIAGSDGGMEGIIKHGVNGFLCEPGNVEQLCEIIKEINNMSAEQKTAISNNAVKTAMSFSDMEVAERYIANVNYDDINNRR